MTSLCFAKKKSDRVRSCGNLGINAGEVVLPQVERSPHDAPTVNGDAPATGARNLGDQSVGAESAEDAADFGAFLFGIFSTLA